MKKAIITGIYGQDGSYLCELLISKGYEVHGVVKHELSENSLKIKLFLDKYGISPILHHTNLSNYDDVKNLIIDIKPDEIYHVAAIHQSSQSQNSELCLFNSNILNTSNILDVSFLYNRDSRIILAGSCLMYDSSNTNIQDESVPFSSKSLYGIAKITENSLAKYYREKGLFACSAILYNHESSRRKDDFVTKKIIKNLVAIKQGKIEKFSLGDILIKKDWGYAKDYAYGMYLMAQQNIPNDYILSSGELYSIKDFIDICATILGIYDWTKYVTLNAVNISRGSSSQLLGNNSLARKSLGWAPSLNLKELIELMIQNEFNGTLF